MFYVYVHFNKQGIPKYVGKGSGARAHKFQDRNPYWKNVFKDDKPIVKIVFKGLTEVEAFRLEVKVYRYFVNKYKLCNLRDCGELSGSRQSEVSREKMRQSKLGHKQTQEQIEKRSAQLRGRKHSQERIKKQADSRRGKKNKNPVSIESKRAKGRSLYCFNNDTVYFTVQEAADALQLKRSSVDKCARGDRTSVFGYRFEFIDSRKGE